MLQPIYFMSQLRTGHGMHLDPKQSLSWAEAASTGTCMGNASEAAQMSVCDWTTTA